MTPLFSLDPEVPACWESPEVLRFGFEAPLLRLTSISREAERFLQRLRTGLRVDPGSTPWGELTRAEWQRLLRELDPILRCETQSRTDLGQPAILLLDSDDLLAGLVAPLSRIGVRVLSARTSTAPIDTAGRASVIRVPVHRFLLRADSLRPPLPESAAELPILVTDQSVILGPFRRSDGSPCAGCAQLHRLAADAKLPVIAAQLLDSRPARLDAASQAHLASCISMLLRDISRDEGASQFTARQLRFPVRDGRLGLIPEVTEITPHPQCDCGARPAVRGPQSTQGELSGRRETGFGDKTRGGSRVAR